MLKPTGDNVLIKKITEEKTESGIVLPDNAPINAIQKGTIVAFGPGHREEGGYAPHEVQVGDTVLYTQYSPQEVKDGGETYQIMKFGDIVAVVDSVPLIPLNQTPNLVDKN